MTDAPRGPRRQQLFAVWLAARVIQGIATEAWAPSGAHQKRVAALADRLKSLSLPAPTRRALNAAIQDLAELTPEAARLAASRLVAPVREAIGADGVEAIRCSAAGLSTGE